MTILLKLFWNKKIFRTNHYLTWFSLLIWGILAGLHCACFFEIWRLINFLKLVVYGSSNIGPRRMHWRLLVLISTIITNPTFQASNIGLRILTLLLLCILHQNFPFNLLDRNSYKLAQLVNEPVQLIKFQQNLGRWWSILAFQVVIYFHKFWNLLFLIWIWIWQI